MTEQEENNWTCLDSLFCYTGCERQCDECKQFDDRRNENTNTGSI